MKTVLITNGNIMSLMSLKSWIDKYHNDIVCLVITTKLPSSDSNIKEVINILKKSGFLYAFFKILTNKIFPIYYKITGKYVGVVDYLHKKNKRINIIYAENVNDDFILNKIKNHQPEIILSFSATTKFSKKLINIPSKICVNAHYALLPKYAGLSPYYWYLHNNEEICGCTFHKISEKLDAGDIIERKTFLLKGCSSVMSVLLKQIELISPMLINYYAGKTSENIAEKQELSERTYYRHPLKKDIGVFLKNKNTFFDKKSLKIFLHGINKTNSNK